MGINVNWIDAKEKPAETGSYYTVLEARRDVKAILSEGIEYRAGDILMHSGWFSVEKGRWEDPTEDDPNWKVLLWAEELEPDTPQELGGRVREYSREKARGWSRRRTMNTKELIAACRDTADALGDANLRISTSKFDSRSVSDLLWAAAAALEAKCSCGKAGAECGGDRKQSNGDWFRSLTDEQLLDSPFRGALCDMVPSCQTGGHIACGDCLRGFLAAEHEG